MYNTHEWMRALEDGDNIDVIYFDFAKACDTVPHCRLLTKLKNVGLVETSSYGQRHSSLDDAKE